MFFYLAWHTTLFGDGWQPLPCSCPFPPSPTASTLKQLPEHPSSPLPHSNACLLPSPSVSSLLVLVAQELLRGWNKPLSCKLEATFSNGSHSETVFSGRRGLFFPGKSHTEKRSPNTEFFYTSALDGHHRNRWSDRTYGHNSSVLYQNEIFFSIIIL